MQVGGEFRVIVRLWESDNRSLVSLKPVHDLSEGVRTMEKCLTVGMFRGIQ